MEIDFSKSIYSSDSLADKAIEDIFGPWSSTDISQKNNLTQDLMRAIRGLQSNADLNKSSIHISDNSKVGAALSSFFKSAHALPDWADLGQIKVAENIFKENGLQACVLFFCASLPEVYALSDITNLLNITGKLENSTEQRIRSTAYMILSVLLPDGLTAESGVGRVYTLKARLIHALIRFLVLRESPLRISEKLKSGEDINIDPIQGAPPQNLIEATTMAGWDLSRGIPCNQLELAYTLLTFHYVFVRSMRRLGLDLNKDEESAYFHAWNIVGYFMGIEDELLFHDFVTAEKAFHLIRKRAGSLHKKGQEGLGEALMEPIERSISIQKLKPFARLITEYLTSRETVQALGIHRKVPKIYRLAFKATMRGALTSDQYLPRLHLDLSLVRFTLRIAGYQLLFKILNDRQQPLELPNYQVDQVKQLLKYWSYDFKSPGWLNSLEDKLTEAGEWKV